MQTLIMGRTMQNMPPVVCGEELRKMCSFIIYNLYTIFMGRNYANLNHGKDHAKHATSCLWGGTMQNVFLHNIQPVHYLHGKDLCKNQKERISLCN